MALVNLDKTHFEKQTEGHMFLVSLCSSCLWQKSLSMVPLMLMFLLGLISRQVFSCCIKPSPLHKCNLLVAYLSPKRKLKHDNLISTSMPCFFTLKCNLDGKRALLICRSE